LAGGESLVGLGFLLVFLGVFLIFVGVLASALRGGGEVEAGGVIVVGPVPIVFGTSSKAALAAAILGLAMMLIALFIWLQARGVAGG